MDIIAATGIPSQNIEALIAYISGQANEQQVIEMIQDDDFKFKQALQLIMQFNTGDVSQIVDTKGESLETSAIIGIALIKLNRAEIADQFCKKLLGISDEETLFQLCSAWAALAQGDYEDAEAVANELIDRYGKTALLHNLSAVCAIHDENFNDAKHALTVALEASQDSGDKEAHAASLINMMTYNRQQGEEVTEHYNKLTEIYPDHPYLEAERFASELFDKCIS